MGTLAFIGRQRRDMRGGSGDLPPGKFSKFKYFEMQFGAIWVLKLV